MKVVLRNLSIFLCASLLLLSANAATSPYQKADREWINISGTVVSSNNETFVLDYGEGLITVEMDDWDWYKEGWSIIDGDEVVVSGRIDADLFQKRTIEAGSVYVKNQNTYYYASSADEEIDPYYIVNYALPAPLHDGHWMNVSGRVTQVNGRELSLNTGNEIIKVDTKEMSYNPLDDTGHQKIRKGDRVTVGGVLDLDLFERREIDAVYIVTLQKDKQKSSKK